MMSSPSTSAAARGCQSRALALLAGALWLFWLAGALRAQGGCPPPGGTESHPQTGASFDVLLDGQEVPVSFTASGPTAVRHGDPVGGTVPTEIVQLALSGVHADFGPFEVSLASDQPSLGQASEFFVDQDGVCASKSSFFDVFVDITFPGQQNLVFTNRPAIRLVGPAPVPLPHVRQFEMVQAVGAAPPVLVNRATGQRVGVILNVRHLVPPRNPCPCFPPAGLDVMHSRLGHTLEIPGIGICAPLMVGPVVIRRGDPFVHPATGLCCIDIEMVALDLWGFDPACGRVHITLNPAVPSKGQICEQEKGKCFPANSCLDVFIRVELVDKGMSFVNCNPIVMCCKIDQLPPFGCPYAVQNAPVPLYREPAAGNVCALEPLPPPAAFIREALHTPEPQPTCPPRPAVQTSESEAQILIDTPDGPQELVLRGPTTTEIGLGGPDTIPIEILMMELSGGTTGEGQPGPVSLRLSRRLRSVGQALNCRIHPQFNDPIADSFFDVFFELEIPDRQNPVRTLSLFNPQPVRMVGDGIPLIHNRPFQLVQANPGVPLLDPAGNVVARVRQVIHRLPPPPPPRCDCFPRAGIDRFRSKLLHSIEVPGIGLVKADCEGPVVVRRGDPRLDPATGLCVIDTVIEDMLLWCSDPLVGEICITLNKKKVSRGTVTQLDPADCFPALSCFDIFIRVELKTLGIVLVNCEPVRMCCRVTSLPPFGCPYAIQNPGLPLYREPADAPPEFDVCDLKPLPPPVGFIREATHTPEPPAEPCTCYPPAGSDVMETNLWHEIIIPGVGVCRAHLSGQVVVERSGPVVDPATGKCCIRTVMRSMLLTGFDPVCGKITIRLNPAIASTGLICEQVPGTCFPADSFFDIFIIVETEHAGTFVNCDPAHMRAVIHSLPPWNAFYNLDLEGLPLHRFSPTVDVCTVQPRPAAAASIGKALHVPRQPCTCFGPGKDVMDSILAHEIDLLGLGKICKTPLRGRVEVERHPPYLGAGGLCCQDTEITFLELSAVDPVCGPIKIRLNPDRASTGFICQEKPDGCFPAQSCFRVFIIVEVMGMVLENCEPAIMCCRINTLPPYECAYLLSFGDRLPLFRQGECRLPEDQRKPVAEILADSTHTPKPCPPAAARCAVVDGHAVITVIADPSCPCDRFQVTRDDGTVVPAIDPPSVFRDPERCTGSRTYTVRCLAGGALSEPVTVECPCPPPPCEVKDLVCIQEPTGVRLKWTTDPAGCCSQIAVTQNGVRIALLPGAAAEFFAEGPCPANATLEFCVICLDAAGIPGPPACCRIVCPDPCAGVERKVSNLTCTNLQPLAAGVRLRWMVNPDCPCVRVRILRDGVEIAVVPAAQGEFIDPTDCDPSQGPCVTREYCVVCIDEQGQEAGPRVCCKLECGRCACPERQVRDLRCERALVGGVDTVVLKWTQDPDCPCEKVQVLRDGVVLAEAPAAAGTFLDPCTPGEHEYCVVCIDPSGAAVGPKVCCRIVCPAQCNCPPAGVDRLRSSLVHLIEVPGFGRINASMAGPVVVERGDPFIDPSTSLCCLKTRITEMLLLGTDARAGPIKITLNPCKPSEGIICQKTRGPECFPALSCFEIFIRIELPELGLVLVNCEPIRMCCEITALPPFGCPYSIQDVPVPLYKEYIDPAAPCRSVCDLPASQRPAPVAEIINATHKPEPPVEDCACFPQGGIDRMETNLFHEIVIPGAGTCRAGLRGVVEVRRSNPFKDAATGKCCIRTEMVTMSLSGSDPLCGRIEIGLNPRRPSTGLICERVAGTCFPADSFFDIFIEVKTEKAGTFVNCDPARMEALINSLPPWNSFYILNLQGLDLFRVEDGRDPCVLVPRPAPAAEIGQALHVPRQPCTCFGAGVDVMDSTLVHDIRIPGLNKSCSARFRGLLEVERGEPYLDANGLCAVDTVMRKLELVADDPECGRMVIRLNPELASGGFIRQLSKEACFPAKSCFRIFVEVEVMGLVLRNCEPAVVCCEINALPPFGCTYQLNFGADVPLWRPEDCRRPAGERPAPVGVIVQVEHVPQPLDPCKLEVQCVVEESGIVRVQVSSQPEACCEAIRVVRDDGTPLVAAALPNTFIDPERCREGTRTYKATCVGGRNDGAMASCTVLCKKLVRGDTNGDGLLDISDPTHELGCQFLGGGCQACFDIADYNGDGRRDLTDPVGMLTDLFLGTKVGSPEPVACR